VVSIAVAVSITVSVAVSITVSIAVSITVSITVPVPIAIVVIEAARAAETLVTDPATYALDFLDDTRLVLRQSNTGRAGEADRIGAVGQQRRAQYGGGGQGDKQKLVHLSTSRFFAVRLGAAGPSSNLGHPRPQPS
jgi:hypothetical protein